MNINIVHTNIKLIVFLSIGKGRESPIIKKRKRNNELEVVESNNLDVNPYIRFRQGKNNDCFQCSLKSALFYNMRIIYKFSPNLDTKEQYEKFIQAIDDFKTTQYVKEFFYELKIVADKNHFKFEKIEKKYLTFEKQRDLFNEGVEGVYMCKILDSCFKNNHWVAISRNLIFDSSWDHAKAFSKDNIQSCSQNVVNGLSDIIYISKRPTPLKSSMTRKRKRKRSKKKVHFPSTVRKKIQLQRFFVIKQKLSNKEQATLGAFIEENKKNFKKTDNILTSINGAEAVTLGEYIKLVDGGWLHDGTVNFYMNLLSLRDAKFVTNEYRKQRSYFFTSFFFERLSWRSSDSEDKTAGKFDSLQKWTSKRNTNVFDYDKLFFPVNIAQGHWLLVVIWLKEKEIRYYDSMGDSCFEQTTKKFLDYMQIVHKIDSTKWRCVNVLKEDGLAQQENGNDCGVYMLMFCDCLAVDVSMKKFNASQAKISRYRIANSLMIKKAYM